MGNGQRAVRSMLEDALERNAEEQRALRRERDELPHGSVSIKSKGERKYCYVQYRSGGKMRTDYMGAADEVEADVREKIEKRKQIDAQIKELQEEQSYIERALALK